MFFSLKGPRVTDIGRNCYFGIWDRAVNNQQPKWNKSITTYTIDGGVPATFSGTPGASDTHQQSFFNSGVLADGTHTLVIINQLEGPMVCVDFLEYTPSPSKTSTMTSTVLSGGAALPTITVTTTLVLQVSFDFHISTIAMFRLWQQHSSRDTCDSGSALPSVPLLDLLYSSCSVVSPSFTLPNGNLNVKSTVIQPYDLNSGRAFSNGPSTGDGQALMPQSNVDARPPPYNPTNPSSSGKTALEPRPR
ncbi:hypothetical protein C8J56DRAFT_1059499 [Mycena floridula]|nr:hypothetical protein C8J56DRAFT_1059499 [Mycena floridula]